MSIARAGSGLVVHDDVVYIIGGIDGRVFLNTMEFARIQKDGTLTPWQPGPPLNEERGFMDAVVHNGWLYVVGGGNGPNGHNLLRSVERARIKSDGTLEPWIVEVNPMLVPRRCSKIVAVENALYSFGGFGGALLDTVERAAINPDGSLQPWRMETERLTIPRYVNGVKAVANTMYALGGHDQTRGVGVQSVEWSRPGGADGALQPWRATNPLRLGRYGLATASHEQFVYVLGGITGAEYTDSIEIATRQSDGSLSVWADTTPLPQPLASFSAFTHRGRLYVVGGTNLGGYSRGVAYASVGAQGELGYFGTKEDAQAHTQAQTQRAATQSTLPNVGVVREIIHASAYSYVRVETDSGERWLAGPKTELAVGSRVRFSDGVYMQDFFSKELQRSFPAVNFVGSLVPEQ